MEGRVRVSTRKVSDLLDRKSYKSELKVWSDTPNMAGDRQDVAAVLETREEEEVAVSYKGT